MVSEKFKEVIDGILEVINKQEMMHNLGMSMGREVGVEVMFFNDGAVAIEPELSCDGVTVEVGEEKIDPEAVVKFLTVCSTSFRENFDAEVDKTHKTQVIRIKKKAK